MNNIIEIEELTFSYSKNIVFQDLSLIIPKNTFTTVLGNNGAGKTTLINLIMGRQNSNTYIMIDGIPIIKEDFSLIKEDIIEINPKSLNNKNKIIDEFKSIKNKKQIETKIKNFKLDIDLEKRISSLSKEQKITIMIIKALLQKPKIIIIDNQLEHLNYYLKTIAIKELQKLTKKDTTVINFTTNTEDIFASNFIAILNNNQAFFGSFNSLIENNEILDYLKLKTPFIIELSQKLKFYNLIDKIYIDIEKLVNDLWT